MRLYHGSNMLITRPDLSRSKPFKDFGRGFYLSPTRRQAEERGRQMADLLQTGSPCVSVFDWDEVASVAAGVKIKRFEDYCEEWADFILQNRDRKRPQPVHDYDIVIGPIADDGVTYQLRRYSEGDISMERLIEELKYSRGMTIQYFFGTECALSYLRKL